MCEDCGCGLNLSPSPPHPSHGSPESPSSSHSHPHSHSPTSPPADRQQILVLRSLLERNQRFAERNRGYFRAKRLLVLNIVSSPGSGKTTLIQHTAAALAPHIRLGAIVGDLATDRDAQRLRSAGLPVVQIATGTLCHLEAEMVGRAADSMDLDALDILVVENVGNLVCPAAYDLGEHLRVVLLSVTEGEDKPLKYPPLFHSAHAALITKTDLAGPAAFDRSAALAHLHQVSHHARIFEVSVRSGDGMKAWTHYLTEQLHATRA